MITRVAATYTIIRYPRSAQKAGGGGQIRELEKGANHLCLSRRLGNQSKHPFPRFLGSTARYLLGSLGILPSYGLDQHLMLRSGLG